MDAGRTLDGGPLPIDLEHLSRYTAAKPDTTRELLIIFRDQAETWLGRMSPDDPAAWRETAHTLKGAAKAIGAWPLAELCEGAETLTAPAADLAARHALLAQLRSEIERARHYIDQVIEPLAG
ncbi:MAG: Hpt domain-containing protein [Alphaproteobacteria bacterium]